LKLKEIRKYLDARFFRVDPHVVLPAIRDEEETSKDLGPDTEDDGYLERELVTDMFVAKPLTYVTLEKEDLEQEEPVILRVFSFTRGLDFKYGAIPNSVITDLIEAKYGFRPRFYEGKDPDDHTILGWQSLGLWRAGVQLFVVDEPDQVEIEHAVEYADRLAALVSSINLKDLWRLRSKIGGIPEEKLASILTNLQARMFEDRVADFLRRTYGYADVETRYKPPYLHGREIDVYAVKSQLRGTTRVTICECKMALDDREIAIKEIKNFKNLSKKVKLIESSRARNAGSRLKFEAWFITNSKNLPNAARTLTNSKFRIMVAHLPLNWMRMDSWEIVSIEPVEPL